MSNRWRRSRARCRSWDVTFPLPAWETQPLVPCHLPYQLRLTSRNQKNLVAMVSGWILMICSEELLCRGFIETSLVLPKSAPCLHVYNRSKLIYLPKVIRTTLGWKRGSWWRVLFSVLSGCRTECHLAINLIKANSLRAIYIWTPVLLQSVVHIFRETAWRDFALSADVNNILTSSVFFFLLCECVRMSHHVSVKSAHTWIYTCLESVKTSLMNSTLPVN